MSISWGVCWPEIDVLDIMAVREGERGEKAKIKLECVKYVTLNRDEILSSLALRGKLFQIRREFFFVFL